MKARERVWRNLICDNKKKENHEWNCNLQFTWIQRYVKWHAYKMHSTIVHTGIFAKDSYQISVVIESSNLEISLQNRENPTFIKSQKWQSNWKECKADISIKRYINLLLAILDEKNFGQKCCCVMILPAMSMQTIQYVTTESQISKGRCEIYKTRL